MRIVTEKDLRVCIKLDHDAVKAVEQGFAYLSQGKATVPPILMLPVPEQQGEVDVKTAYMPDIDKLAVKIASGFFNNNKKGLPSASGMMILLNSRTGFPEAILLDNGYLTQVRTGAAGSIAAKHLAPSTVTHAGVIGTGTQGRFQMRGLKLERDFKTLHVFSLDPEDTVEAYRREMAEELKVEVIIEPTVQAVVEKSAVVVTTTPARKGFIRAEWLHPGLHITAMGSDTEEKQELMPEVFSRADVTACDLKSQCFSLGELRSALEAGILTRESPVIELGELVAGTKKGRTSDNQITLCDLTGVGVQDTAIALQALSRAEKQGLGTVVE